MAKTKLSELNGIRKEKKRILFKINKYISLELIKSKTQILINGKVFANCKYLVLNIPVNETYLYDNIESVDHLIEEIGHELNHTDNEIQPTSKQEFWGHCSNIQAWVESDYDTRVIDSRLAFPILKKLCDLGDPKALKVFKEELAYRLVEGHNQIFRNVIAMGYLHNFSIEELTSLRLDLIDKGLTRSHETIDGIDTMVKYKKEHVKEELARKKQEEYDKRRMERLEKMWAIQKDAVEKERRKKQVSLVTWMISPEEDAHPMFKKAYQEYKWLIQMLFRHSVGEVAKRCHVTKPTIYYWIHQHSIYLKGIKQIKKKWSNQYKNKQYQY